MYHFNIENVVSFETLEHKNLVDSIISRYEDSYLISNLKSIVNSRLHSISFEMAIRLCYQNNHKTTIVPKGTAVYGSFIYPFDREIKCIDLSKLNKDMYNHFVDENLYSRPYEGDSLNPITYFDPLDHYIYGIEYIPVKESIFNIFVYTEPMINSDKKVTHIYHMPVFQNNDYKIYEVKEKFVQNHSIPNRTTLYCKIQISSYFDIKFI